MVWRLILVFSRIGWGLARNGAKCGPIRNGSDGLAGVPASRTIFSALAVTHGAEAGAVLI
jgi:hypothetical protein